MNQSGPRLVANLFFWPSDVFDFDIPVLDEESLSDIDNVLDDQQCDSSESDEDVGTASAEPMDFQTDLAKWAVKNKITRTAVDELLSVLREHGHRPPKNARTLLKTPRQVETKDLCGGQYRYFGRYLDF